MAFLGASLRIHPTFCNATTDHGSCQITSEEQASDWWICNSQPIRNTNLISVVTRHQYGISAVVPQKLFHGETGGSVAKYRLFSQTIIGA